MDTHHDAVLVTGATGFLGSAVVTRLLALDPHTQVYALVRSPERWSAVAPLADDRRRNIRTGLIAADADRHRRNRW